jgi:hypothetical protein
MLHLTKIENVEALALEQLKGIQWCIFSAAMENSADGCRTVLAL